MEWLTWPVGLCIALAVVVAIGLGVLANIARKAMAGTTTTTSGAGAGTTPPAGTTTHPWIKRVGDNWNKWWIIIPITIVLFIIAIAMTGIHKYLFSDSLLLFGTIVVVTAIVVASFRNDITVETNRKLVGRLCFWTIVLVIGAVIYSKTESSLPNVGNTVTAGVKDFFKPAPPAPIKWTGEKVVEVPAKIGWDKAIEVELPWNVCQWSIVGLIPNPNGRYEIMSRGWSKPFVGGGIGNFTLPQLTSSRKFKLRSIESESLTVKVSWR